MLPSRWTWAGWRNGPELHEVQEEQVKNPASWVEGGITPGTSTDCSQWARRQLYREGIWCPCGQQANQQPAENVKSILDCIRISVVIRSREVIPLLSSGKPWIAGSSTGFPSTRIIWIYWGESGASCMKMSKELQHLTAKTAGNGQPGKRESSRGSYECVKTWEERMKKRKSPTSPSCALWKGQLKKHEILSKDKKTLCFYRAVINQWILWPREVMEPLSLEA